jgi:hypothetical protein
LLPNTSPVHPCITPLPSEADYFHACIAPVSPKNAIFAAESTQHRVVDRVNPQRYEQNK